MKAIMEQWLSEKKAKTAICFKGLVLTYSQLYILSCQAGNLFESRNANKILFCLYNSPSVILCYLGAWLSGKTALPVNPRLTNLELIKVIEQYSPEMVIVENERLTPDFLKCCHDLSINIYYTVNDCQYQGSFWNDLLGQKIDSPKGYQPNSKTIHLTSGTTGQYKVVAHTLSQIEKYAKRRSRDFGYESKDSILIVTSLNHAFSFSYQLLPALILGLEITLLPKFEPEKVYNVILENNITTIGLLPIMSYQLSRYAAEKSAINSLRYVIVAGDSVPTAFNDGFKRVFGVPLYQGVGMTEVYGYAQNKIHENKAGSAGKLLPGVQLKVMNELGQELAENEEGELFLKTETNIKSYLGEHDLSKQTIQNGWIKTGDIGYLDSDGFLWFLGRSKQIIISGGSNISPMEVEQALYQHEGILEAGVIGHPDPIWGQVIWAYVSMTSEYKFDEPELIKFTQQYIAKYKCPKKIMLLDELPKTSSGKIDRYCLKKLAQKCK